MVSSKKIIFLACGSFNPPTPMHLRMFEIARDHFRERAEYEVIGGIISPVHDSYGKPELALGKDRCAMVKISLQTSDWIRLSDWECNEQSDWTRTRISLQYHQNYINSVLNDSTTNGVSGTIPSWLPPNIYKYKGDRVQVKLLCGADLLESFATPKLWKDDDIEAMLGEHGIVVITRSETCPEKFIFQSDLLTKYKHRIDIITNWVPNEVSSTLARRYLRRGLSVKYMLDDNVVEYIRHKKLFGVDSAKYIITPGESETTAVQSLSPNYINDNYIKKTDQANYNYETMDETDHTPKKSSLKSTATSDDATATTATDDDRSRRLSANQPKCRLSRPGQAIQIRTDMNGTRTIDHEDEVGVCKISTITLSPDNKSLEKKIEYISDNQLDKLTNGVSDNDHHGSVESGGGGGSGDRVTGSKSIDTLSAECLPSTTKRSQNDLIQFVFTSHGIRVISDKEYVV